MFCELFHIHQPTSSKAPLSGGIPSFLMELRTEYWRARRRRLWIATMLVRLFTVTNGIVKLASCEDCSRFMNSSIATSRSFRIASLCLSVTGSPMEFFTASRLTNFPRSSAEGKSPEQNFYFNFFDIFDNFFKSIDETSCLTFPIIQEDLVSKSFRRAVLVLSCGNALNKFRLHHKITP